VALFNRNSELARRLLGSGIEVLELDESVTSASVLGLQVLSWARRMRPDVIHTHRFKENIIGGLVSLYLGVPSLRTVHGAAEPELMNSSKRRKILDWTDATVASCVQRGAVAVSDDLAVRLKKLLPGARIFVVTNGVDAEELRHRAIENADIPIRKPGTLRIGYFGRLVPVKRLDLLLESVAELRRQTKGPVELFIVGEGPDQAALLQYAKDLGVADATHFVGFKANVSSWVREMDGVVLTSDHEGLPMIVLEALALGVPVVARAVGGIPEVLGSVNTAWLVDGNSPSDVARTLASTLAPREGTLGESLLPQRYSAMTMAANYLNVYRTVACVSRPRRAGREHRS
jgi:glycosyltransferase involved in cell wall biosynthesis